MPLASTLNSYDGRIKANAAIVPAGSGGAISVFATDATDLIIDIDGYFVADSSQLAFYPLPPCRVLDTRNATGSLGGPIMNADESRDFPIQASACGIPPSAQAYSLNFTVVPEHTLGYLTVWPSGGSRPVVSTLNSPTGNVTANATILPAGAGGNISAYVTDTTDLIADINGYFAAPGPGGQSLYSVAPCRVLDTRSGTGAFRGELTDNVAASPCALSSGTGAFVFNSTVVPQSSLGYLTLWPDGSSQPVVSTLNALDGAITSNMAIVPSLDGSVDAFTTDKTDLILDVFGYFAGANGQPTVSAIAISPTDLNVGQQQQLIATATYSDGSTATVAPQTWSSSNTQLLTVSTSGIATGMAYGQSSVSASFSGVQGNVNVNVHGGALNITIIGTVTGTVTVTGPSNFAQTIAASQTLQVAPGSYIITGNAATRGSSTYWPSVQSQSVAVSDGGSASAAVDYSTIIPTTTKVLDAAGISSLVVSPDGTTITISSSSAVAESLNVGDVLAVAPSQPAPSGLLLKILTISKTASTVTAGVRQAALTEAIQQATVHFSQALSPQTLTANSQKLLTKRRLSSASRQSASPKGSTGACSDASLTLQLPYSVPLSQGVLLSGEDDLCATLNLDFQITLFTLQSLNATLTAGAHTSVNLSDTVMGSFSVTQDLPALQWPAFTLFVGDIPIGVTPSLIPFVGANGNAKVTISTGISTDTTLTIGASFSNGVWAPVQTDVTTAASLTTSSEGDVNLKGFAGARAELYIVTEPLPIVRGQVDLGLDGYLQLTGQLTGNPCWSLDAGLEANAGIAASIFDVNLQPYTTPSLNLYTANVAKASGPCYTVTVTPPTSMIDVQGTVQLRASEVDLLGNPVNAQIDWASSDPSIATVDQTGLVTGVASGTVQVTATDPDTKAVGTANVTVGAGAPTYFLGGNWAGTVTVTDGQTQSTYSVGASISQTGNSLTATLMVQGQDGANIYTVSGQIVGNTVTFTTASNDISDGVDATGTISPNSLQVSGSDSIGTGNGMMTWDGLNTLTGTVSLVEPGSVDVWTSTVSTDGQHLTGGSTANTGDSASWNLTRQ